MYRRILAVIICLSMLISLMPSDLILAAEDVVSCDDLCAQELDDTAVAVTTDSVFVQDSTNDDIGLDRLDQEGVTRCDV